MLSKDAADSLMTTIAIVILAVAATMLLRAAGVSVVRFTCWLLSALGVFSAICYVAVQL